MSRIHVVQTLIFSRLESSARLVVKEAEVRRALAILKKQLLVGNISVKIVVQWIARRIAQPWKMSERSVTKLSETQRVVI